MANLREVRECLLLGYDLNLLNDEEFMLFYDLNSSKNPDFPYWRYERFDLEELTDDECKAEFRFYKNDIYVLKEALQVPEQITCYNRLVVSGIEALCILLKRFAYPIRYGDMIARFGRPAPQFSIISYEIMNIMYTLHSHCLSSFR